MLALGYLGTEIQHIHKSNSAVHFRGSILIMIKSMEDGLKCPLYIHRAIPLLIRYEDSIKTINQLFALQCKCGNVID